MNRSYVLRAWVVKLWGLALAFRFLAPGLWRSTIPSPTYSGFSSSQHEPNPTARAQLGYPG